MAEDGWAYINTCSKTSFYYNKVGGGGREQLVHVKRMCLL